MPRYFISELQIEGFRGINNQGMPLKLKMYENKVNSIFSPNGGGKSSIFDALCFAIKGHVPKLMELQRSEEADNYYINKFHPSNRAVVNIKFIADDGSGEININITRDSRGRISFNSAECPNPKEFLKSLDHDCVLVDYNAFNRFVSDTPLNRGRTFSSLVGMSKISALKQAFDTLSDTRNLTTDFQLDILSQKIRDFKKNILDIETEIRDLIKKLGGELNGSIDIEKVSGFMMKKLKSIKIFTEVIKDNQFFDIKFDELARIVREAEGGDLKNQLSAKIKELTKIKSLDSIDIKKEKDQLHNIGEILKQKEMLLSNSKGDYYLKLFTAAKNIFEKDEMLNKNTCPLCNSVLEYEDGRSLYDHIIEWLSGFSEIEKLDKEANKLWMSFAGRERMLNLEKNPLPEHGDDIFTKIDLGFRNSNVHSSDLFNSIQWVDSRDKLLKEKMFTLNVAIEEIKRVLPASLVEVIEVVENGRNIQVLAAKMIKLKDMLRENEYKLNKRNRWASFVKTVSEQITTAEAALSRAICDEIEDNTCSYFMEITSNDAIKPSLVRSQTGEQLVLGLSSFYEASNLNAVPLLSESYRNALALSIFLATLLRHSGQSRFVVLDDITSSFDAGHQFMLMELLKNKISTANNSNGLQVILLSHDGLLEKYFDREFSVGGNWYHVKLQGLPPTGNIIVDPQQQNRLKDIATQYLNTGQTQLSYPLIRQYLEFKLTEIIRKLKIAVPIDFAIRDDKKMVSHSLNAINAAIDIHRRANSLVLSNKQLNDLSAIYVPSIIANWVNHYETGSTASFTPRILLGVLDTIEKFTECFKYTCSCSGRPVLKYYKSLSEKGCRCP